MASTQSKSTLSTNLILLENFSVSPCGKAHETFADAFQAVRCCLSSKQGNNMLCAHTSLHQLFSFDNKQILKSIVRDLQESGILSNADAVQYIQKINNCEKQITVLDILRRKSQPSELSNNNAWMINDKKFCPDYVEVRFTIDSMPSTSVIKAILTNLLNSFEFKAGSKTRKVGFIGDMNRFNRIFNTCETLIGAELNHVKTKLLELSKKLPAQSSW